MTRHSLLVLNPLAQAVASRVAAADAEGKAVSCRAACGACCRQLVVVSTVEAVGLADEVAALPPDRQELIRARFAAAHRVLEEAGLLEPPGENPRTLRARFDLPADEVLRSLSKAYFDLGLACPFLDDESCSIYESRPTICREYQVTTPAEWCARVYDEPVEGIRPSVKAGKALMAAAHEVGGLPARMVPFVMALEWAERLGPEVRAERYGDELVRAFEAALNADSPPRPATATANIEFGLLGRAVTLEVTVPTAPATPRAVLPFGRAIADVVAAIAAEESARAGRPVSCRAGCGACCRQLLSLSEAEAHDIAASVAAMPEERRAEVLGRFAALRQKLEEAGLTAALADMRGRGERELFDLKRAYFRLGLACPFLDDESCSIYESRPLVCRGYLVTNDPALCSEPSLERVTAVPLPVISPFRSFANATHDPAGGERSARIPMAGALDWAAAHQESPTKTGPEWLRVVFAAMTGATPPPADEEGVG